MKQVFDTKPVKELHFDYQNPRLAEYGIGEGDSEDKILSILWQSQDVRELVQSIAASGFFPHEALVITKESGKYVVIEGNRRLAAVKVLLGEAADKGWDIPKISPAAREKLKELPVIESSRKEAWRYLGFKHVNGPAKWSGYAKATYIAAVHREYGVSLVDIANQIGDRHRTVQRLYRGLMVVDQADRQRCRTALILHRAPRSRSCGERSAESGNCERSNRRDLASAGVTNSLLVGTRHSS